MGKLGVVFKRRDEGALVTLLYKGILIKLRNFREGERDTKGVECSVVLVNQN